MKIRAKLTTNISLIGLIIFLFSGFSLLAQEEEGWLKRESKPNTYEMGMIKDIERGKEVYYLKSIKKKIDGTGVIMQNINPDKYKGQRVKLSGYIKTENIEEWAGMWMRVDGEGYNTILGFDNMNDRPIKGSTKWTKYEIVLDVPDSSINISYGFLFRGIGQAWIDDFKFDIVDKSVKLTHMINRNSGWFRAGSKPLSYQIGTIKNSERKKDVEYLKSVDSRIVGFGTIMKCMAVDDYKGKRLRLTGYIKTKDIEKWAGMWMRVDAKRTETQKKNRTLSFDNMGKRPIKGTTKWTKYEIVLDVPNESAYICFGVLIYGTGEVWIDDFNFEEVDISVPVTGTYKMLNPK